MGADLMSKRIIPCILPLLLGLTSGVPARAQSTSVPAPMNAPSSVTAGHALCATVNPQQAADCGLLANSVLANPSVTVNGHALPLGGALTLQFSDLSGTVAASQLPNPGPSSLGGVESLAPVAHQFLTGISTSGVPSVTQPAIADLSDGATVTLLSANNTLTGVDNFTGTFEIGGYAVSLGGALVTTGAGNFGASTNATLPSGTFTVAGLGLAQTFSATQTFSAATYSALFTGGNVGIGTATPATTLSVAGNGYFTGGQGAGVENTTAGTLKTSGNIIVGGNVGIVDAAPSVKLEVQGSTVASSAGTEEELTLYRPLVAGVSFPQVATLALGTYGPGVEGNYYPDTRLDILLKSTAVSNDTPDVTVMSLLSNGDVGIGTTTPKTTLDVNGGIRAAVKTVSGLPTCSSAIEGTRYGVSDASSPVALATVVGGGSSHVPVYCNGTNWIVY
jgi:hypothetical protein